VVLELLNSQGIGGNRILPLHLVFEELIRMVEDGPLSLSWDHIPHG
jgi:hypothetical protein